MIPNMYKIAGELTPAVLHVAARSLAAQGLSIFGDHSDVMAVRQTGFALLASASVQEAHDLALVAQAATLRDAGAVRALLRRVPHLARAEHDRAALRRRPARARARGARAGPPRPRALAGAAVHPRHRAEPGRLLPGARDGEPVLRPRARTSSRTRWRGSPSAPAAATHIVDYTGHPEAERVLVVMGSGGETVRETVAALNARGERVGVLQVRLYRPFPAQALVEALPATRAQDRRARPDEGAGLDRRAALPRHGRRADRVVRATASATVMPRVVGGRYGLSSKEFTPGMVAGVFAELGARAAAAPVHDRHQRRRLGHEPRLRPGARHRAGRDRARGLLRPRLRRDGRREQEHDQDPRAEEGLHAQGYFVYDSKKSGSQTVSHLRFGPQPIRAPYLVQQASFVGCHQFGLLEQVDVLGRAARRRDAAAQLPARRRTRCGTRCRGRCRSRSSPSTSTSTRSTPAGSPARSASPAAPTSSCRPASSPSPACCRASRRSTGSRPRSRRPTAGAAPRSSSATRPRSTARSTALHRVEVPERGDGHPRAAAGRPRATRPSSSAPSPRRCWPAAATSCRSARCRSTARTRAARPPTRSATSRSSSRSGTPTSASSAATAASSARTA